MKTKGIGAGYLSLTLGLFLVVLLLAIPTGAAAEKLEGPLYVDTWGGSYADAMKTYLIEPFEKKYGVKVIHNFFGSDPEELAKMKAGKTDMDVVTISDMYAFQGMKDGLLSPIRIENVPNYNDLWEGFQNPPWDPGPEVYSISLIWGDRAIAWNTEKCKAPQSWSALWDKEYSGHVAISGTASETIPDTALYLGQDPNNITDMQAIVDALKELRPRLLKFWTSGADLSSLFANGDVWISNFWRGRVNNLKKEGHPVAYAVPKEGSLVWADTLVIPKNSEHRRAAEAFINFALSPEVIYQIVTKGINYAPTNGKVKMTEAEQQLTGATKENYNKALFQDPEYIMKHRDEWNQILNEVMAGM